MTDRIDKLANKFRALPGVGLKAAQKYAFRVVNMTEEEVEEFAEALIAAKRDTKFCTLCGGYAESAVCGLCSTRDKSVICVVEEPKDILAMEKARGYRGVYHSLGGSINPLKDRAPENLRIKQLLARLEGVTEVIIATTPDIEGDATAVYLSRILKPLGVRVTRIAQGLAIGTELEFADEVTLSKALSNRTEL